MSTQVVANASSQVSSSTANILATFAFGALMILAVGFIPTSEVHNAAHDTRHSAAFPCH